MTEMEVIQSKIRMLDIDIQRSITQPVLSDRSKELRQFNINRLMTKRDKLVEQRIRLEHEKMLKEMK